MAQTKRKRRTKHRGNAAGMVETRGRTGRRPEPVVKDAKARRAERLDRPPTWKAAVNRAAIAAIMFVALCALLLGQSIGASIAIGGVMLLAYIPLGYYTDLFIYRRRQARKVQGKL